MSDDERGNVPDEDVQEVEEEPEVEIRREKYVNEDGKTVVRIIKKKKKKKRTDGEGNEDGGEGKKKTKVIIKKKKKKSVKSPRAVAAQDFVGVPDEQEDWRSKKLKPRVRKENGESKAGDDDGEEDVPEWQKKANRARDLDALLSPRLVEQEKPDFRSVLKKRNTVNSPTADSKGDEGEAEPEWKRKARQRKTADLDSQLSRRSDAQASETPNFLAVLKKREGGVNTGSEGPAKSEDAPEFARVALKPRDGNDGMSDEERAKKAEESARKAEERRKARMEREAAEREKVKAAQSANSANRDALQAEISHMQAEKDLLAQEIEKMKAELAEVKAEVKAEKKRLKKLKKKEKE